MIASAQPFDLSMKLSPVLDACARAWDRLSARIAGRRKVNTRYAAPASRPVARDASGQLPASAQWALLSEILTGAGQHAAAAAELQTRATSQIDLAQYGLITLRDELSAVMSLPSRRDAKVVQMFGAAVEPAQDQALAA